MTRNKKIRIVCLALVVAAGTGFGVADTCGEDTCVANQGSYISHFTGAGCTGTESYYLPYDSYGYDCRSWDGNGQCGTIERTVTNKSYRHNGTCYDAWPSGNTLDEFVTVYRGPCGEEDCVSNEGAYISHFTGAGCSGKESYYLPYSSYGYECRSWDGNGICGTSSYTETNKSYRYNGTCYDAWPSGNTLSDFVRVYRDPCGEASCFPVEGTYISHFTGTGCTGTESYYLPYSSYGYNCRTWDGGGQCGTDPHTVTNKSYRYGGTCYDAWPSGNTLSDFVTVYR